MSDRSEHLRPKAPWFAGVVFTLVVVVLHLPLLFLFASSFFERIGETWVFTLRWFQEVLADQALAAAFLNSLIVAVTSSTLATVIGTGAAVALHRGGFRWGPFLRALSLTSLVLPEIVFALALLSWFFLLKVTLGLHSVIAAHVTFILSYVILIVSARLSTMDSSVEDAARDLGAGEWKLLWRVTLPSIWPSVGAAFMLGFLLSFDDFLITFFVNGAGQDTLPVKLYTSMKIGLTPKLNALATLMCAVSALLLIFAFRSSSFRDVLKAGEEPGDQR
ncbi:MAG: ABC transporter permease [Bdellovibrionaceae bacterium]|nr:ABC transporter permease [Pseudobdellovibrionaceae bacterium]